METWHLCLFINLRNDTFSYCHCHCPTLCCLDMNLSWPSANLWRLTSSVWGSSSMTPTWAAWTWKARSKRWKRSSSTSRETMKMWVWWHSYRNLNIKVIILKIFISVSFVASMAIIGSRGCVFGPHFSFCLLTMLAETGKKKYATSHTGELKSESVALKTLLKD